MPTEPNNPAARLIVLLEKARSIPGNVQIRQGWAGLFDVAPDDLPGILLGISDLIQLTHETRRAIEALEGHDHALYLRPIDKILSILTIGRFDIEWAQVTNQLDETTLYGLSVCNDVLAKYSQEKPIAQENIETLLKDVDDLRQEVLGSELPDDLKVFMVEQLEKLRTALLRYRLFGTKSLKSALESITGAVILQGYTILPFWDSPMIKRLIAVLTTVATLVTLSQGFAALSAGIKGLLGSGHP